jgi:outer membrane protein assembly factor BamE
MLPFAVPRTSLAFGLKLVLPMTLLALSGCSYLSFPSWPQHLIYKVDIQQGAVVTKEMAEQLRPGMSREQVRFVMGTPPISDPFHTNRWDYTFRFQPGRGDVVLRHFTIYFDNDRYVRFEGDPLPTEAEFIATRIRLNTEEAKASGVGSTTAVVPNVPAPNETPAPAPAGAPDSGPAATGSASSPAAAPPATPQNANGAITPDKESPSMFDRIKGFFDSSPAQESRPLAPSSPNGPGPAAPNGPTS